MKQQLFCVVQYYRVELMIKAESKEDALSAIQDDARNWYTVTANLDNPDNEVDDISVWAAEWNPEVYLPPADELNELTGE